MSVKTDPRVEEKIAKAPAFAWPILTHLRQLVHTACPNAEETIKWSMPFFLYRGRNMCHMAAFNTHCAFGFWHPEMEKAVAREGQGGKANAAMGLLGRITKLEDLPDDATLLRLIVEAAKHNESGKPARPRPPGSPRKPELAVPTDLALRLASSAAAGKTFENFTPSQRRDYIEWIDEAKREETRLKRIDTTIEWLSEGKQRNWKYANC